MGENTPVVIKYVDISTGHMTKKDNKLLLEGPDSCIVDPYLFGFRVSVDTDDLLSMKKAGFSKQFREIIKWASKKGMDWIQFDQDGPTYPKFKTFNW